MSLDGMPEFPSSPESPPLVGRDADTSGIGHRSCDVVVANMTSGPAMPMQRVNDLCISSSPMPARTERARSTRAAAAAPCNGALLRLRGFTLVELIIAVAVVAILARIAYPSYIEYLKRGNRSAAQSLMLDLANREQQYLLDNRAFLGGGASAVTTLIPSGVPQEVSAYYTVTITATGGPPPTFEVNATPKAGTVMAGESAFTIDQDGTKLPAGKWQGR